MKDLKFVTGKTSGGWLRDLLLLSVVFSIPFLQFLGRLPLMDPDEGRYAEIPREMLERGDLITPTLNYVKYFEKPPLLYWLNSASFKLFGLNEFAARLPSACCGLLTVLTVYVVARHIYGRRAALISAFIMGTAAGFVLLSRIILTDTLLTFCLTATLGAFIVASQREGRRSVAFPWYVFYLFCAFAVLAKGLIGIVFPAGIIFFYLLFSGRWKLLAEMRLVTGILLFLAVSAPWFIAVSIRNPEFAHFFFIREHFERFISTVHERNQPFWFFVPVLIGAMLPWSFFIPGALGRAWRDRHHEDGRYGMFLLVWAVLIFLFFSKSSSKLFPYILPVIPPLAMLIGHRIDRQLEGRGRELKGAAIMLGGTLAVLGVAALCYSRLPWALGRLIELMPGWAIPLGRLLRTAPAISETICLIVGLLFLFQGCGTLATAGRRPIRMLFVIGISSFVLEILAPGLIMEPIARAESPRELALKARSLAGPDTAIVTYAPKQAVSWYLRRRIMVTGPIDELEFGSRQGDQKAWFPDHGALVKLWEQKHVIIFLKKDEFLGVKPLLNPQPIIRGESGHRLLISNR